MICMLMQDERIAHAQTKNQLMENEDKLEFALGEIEILQKQIAREKSQFEKTWVPGFVFKDVLLPILISCLIMKIKVLFHLYAYVF